MTLVLHCGGTRATMADLAQIPVPAATRTFQPIPHLDLILAVELKFLGAGYVPTGRSLGTNRGGKQLFGVTTFAPHDGALARWSEDQAHLRNDLAVGYRSSYDKSLSVGLVSGASVFVCDNLALSGEIQRVRKHTTKLLEDLDAILYSLVMAATVDHDAICSDFALMYKAPINDVWAFRLLGESLGKGHLTATQTQTALREWKRPSHEEWADRKNVWRLYAGMTEALKTSTARTAMPRYTKVHQLVTQHAAMAVA